VIVFHRGRTPAALPGAVKVLHGDRNALAEHADAIAAAGPDVVVDVVPYTEAQAQQAVDVCGAVADRLVAVSSSDVYRNYDGWRGESDHVPDPVPLVEDAPLRDTLYPYRGQEGLDFEYTADYEKILVERVVMEARRVRGTVLRLPAVYGPGDPLHRLGPYVRRMADRRPAILMSEGEATWRWTHGYVENVAAAIATAATHSETDGEVYNVGEADTPPERERVRELGAAVGWNGNVVAMPADKLPPALQPQGHWAYELATDTRRLHNDLGVGPPVSRTEALRRTALWECAAQGEGAKNYQDEDNALHAFRGPGQKPKK
jgi:nucleoside-diphosphate-sugar epimerase